MRPTHVTVLRALKLLADPDDARHAQRFFKTGKGEYAEGDRFLGVRVPAIRACAKRHAGLSRLQASRLLVSPWHEARLCALFIMVNAYRKSGTEEEKEALYETYLEHRPFINNWDLVDASAEHIVGAYLFERDRAILYELAAAPDVWSRRIAIMATFHFIRRGDYSDTLKLAAGPLLHDPHDLIHKAVGWMLREVGNRDRAAETRFLRQHHRTMPRTMLRYAIEKYPERERRAFMQ